MSGENNKARVLDKNRPYSTIRGDLKNRYLQDGIYFDFHGNESGKVDKHYVTDAKPRTMEERRLGTKTTQVVIGKPKASTKTERQKSLERAAASLGDLGLPGASKGVDDPLRENARALAAEDNAE
jgi:hypothetical protein